MVWKLQISVMGRGSQEKKQCGPVQRYQRVWVEIQMQWDAVHHWS